VAHDEPDDEAPLAIQTHEQAKIAAQCLMDYCDFNLSKFEGADMPTEPAQKLYDAAKALVEAFG
jgi:hypothetical protein